MYRVVATDLDGTLLRADKTISEETIAELERITAKGVFFIPSTGRTHRELPDVLKNLPFLRYALCCNGGAVYDFREERYIYEEVIPYDLSLALLEHTKGLPVYESVVINGERICKGDDEGNICEYIQNRAVKGILFNFTGAYDVKAAFAEKRMGAQKFLLYLDDRADKETVINDLREHFPQLAVSSSGPIYIEVNVKGVDKGKALANFCRMQNIPIEESIAFGDAENDVTMLDAAGLAVVMENGTEETKKHADMICPSNDNDGVRIALQKLI
ncbi:MAG: HAD family phosphatase [Oscillospiraceae bacterium]|nr:HAD family phosphatase [Oscillospiraceae bacterium]